MSRSKEIVEHLLGGAGVQIAGTNPWDIQIHNEKFYDRALSRKSLGLGEAYMEGWWDCERLDEFFYKILCADLGDRVRGSWKLVLPVVRAFLFNLQSISRSSMVADLHYNLDNNLFMSFLDLYNQYSCAYFKETEDLKQAQIKKMDMIIAKLRLTPSDHVLDIGFGWGGLAHYMAEKVGCRVTGVNISDEQIKYARERVKGLPVNILKCDFRGINGRFDKIVSVGMFEHVGYKNYRKFMKVVYNSLKDDGIFLLHTIGTNCSQIKTDAWINKYIFPNGVLPSVAQIARSVEGLLMIEDLHNLGPHYDKTLMAWNANFQESWPVLSKRYKNEFKRMWEYYLLSCAGAFRARYNQLWQIVFTKPGCPQPECRI
ncbi:MAG: cyclopropane fatty acyl phospholipid synthase [Deltaproteobacteria bacterium]|nr:cyclopropane fatty acyl phospholipid synthase [Deltaproteobacteria bacterium]